MVSRNYNIGIYNRPYRLNNMRRHVSFSFIVSNQNYSYSNPFHQVFKFKSISWLIRILINFDLNPQKYEILDIDMELSFSNYVPSRLLITYSVILNTYVKISFLDIEDNSSLLYWTTFCSFYVFSAF